MHYIGPSASVIQHFEHNDAKLSHVYVCDLDIFGTAVAY